MKSIPVDPFFSYASQFTLESVLFHITQIAIELFKNTDSQCGRFSGYQNYAVTINGHQRKDRVLLVQTWLIDCLYHVTSLCTSTTETAVYRTVRTVV